MGACVVCMSDNEGGESVYLGGDEGASLDMLASGSWGWSGGEVGARGGADEREWERGGGAEVARNRDIRSSKLPTPTERPLMSLALVVACACAESAVCLMVLICSVI